MSRNFNELIVSSSRFAMLTTELEIHLREITPELLSQAEIAQDPFYHYFANIELDNCLQEIAHELLPHLKHKIDTFYDQLAAIPSAAQWLDGRLMQLKEQHTKELTALFTGNLDEFISNQYSRENSPPAKFIREAIHLLNEGLTQLVFSTLTNDDTNSHNALQFINSIAGLLLLIAQPCYQEKTIAQSKLRTTPEQPEFSYVASAANSSNMPAFSNISFCA